MCVYPKSSKQFCAYSTKCVIMLFTLIKEEKTWL